MGRPLTIKDIGRCVVMTKLAHDPSISLMDAAKYVGVVKKTIQVYRRPSIRPEKSAEILARLDGSTALARRTDTPNPAISLLPTSAGQKSQSLLPASCHSPVKPLARARSSDLSCLLCLT